MSRNLSIWLIACAACVLAFLALVYGLQINFDALAVRRLEAESARYERLAEYESSLADRLRAEGEVVLAQGQADAIRAPAKAAAGAVNAQARVVQWYALFAPFFSLPAGLLSGVVGYVLARKLDAK
jgi:hypothetical protein